MNILKTAINSRPLRCIAISLGMMAATSSLAQAATGLPGGASSLTETYGNWTVTCGLQAQGEAKNVVCSMSQQQVDEKRQRALAIELSPNKTGTGGVFVLPFGLNLGSGAVLQIDENPAEKPLGFSTCLPAGCLVPVNFDAAKSDALSKGKQLTVLAKAIDGNDIKLNVPLDGFAAALKRVKELLK